jgi:conjugative relaxase-like TrwC/TraI family protein
MLTISSGHSADYLLDAVATGRENYYTGAVAAGEPPGRWYGAGAEALGLTGLVEPQDMRALFEHFLDPRDPHFREEDHWDEAATLGHTGRKYQTAEEIYQRSLDAEPYADAERREQLRWDASKRARKNVAFLDVTFSVQKSVTILHTAFEAQEVKARTAGDLDVAQAWTQYRRAVEDAIWAGNQAGLDYLAEHAGYSRIGHHGGTAGRWIDAHDWVITSFFQHDSRNHDPQLHIHNPILNRVLCLDGEWRTIDGRAIYAHRAAAAAVAERTMEERLTAALGVQLAMRPDGRAREVLGIPDVVTSLFSSRRRAITPKTAELVDAFETKHGRAPNTLELDRLQRQATFATRRPKSHEGETTEQRLDRVDRELHAEIDSGLDDLATQVLILTDHTRQPANWSRHEVIATALAEVQSKQAAWSASDLGRAINNALPDHLGLTDGKQFADLLLDLTGEALALAVPLDVARPAEDALPDELRVANGRSAYEAPRARLYATPEHIHTERILAHAGRWGGAPAVDSATAQAFLDQMRERGCELGDDQAAAVCGILTSTTDVEALVGPAGTGKSFVLGVLAQAWEDPAIWDGQQHRVVGLASSQIATNVLAEEGLAARNIARWLATQDRLAAGTGTGDDRQWRLNAGDLIVVDESAMTNTSDLVAIQQHAVTAGAKLLLTGDHRQLAAIGPAGGMELIVDSAPRYELTDARRFTNAWERDASLRLRDGDVTVLGEYHKHGRLLDAGALEQAERSAARSWLADTLAGRRALLIVDTNEQAARLSAHIRTQLIGFGRVTEDGVPLGLQGTLAGVGDIVQARHNGWKLVGVYGNRRGPINREHYRVVETLDDGGLVVETLDRERERITLPGRYVTEHVALGYATTVHAAQGVTVDCSHSVITSRTGPASLYVGLSRGRDANTAHVCTRAISDDAPAGTVNQVVHRDPITVLATTFEVVEPEQSALATLSRSEAEVRSIRTPGELFADACEIATAGRTARWLDELVDAGHLAPSQRIQLAAEDGATTLHRLLRRVELAGHDVRRVLTEVVTSRDLAGARQLTNVIHHRITNAASLDPVGERHGDWIPQVDDPAWQHYLTVLAEHADTRRDQLGRELADAPPQWALEALGPVPARDDERGAWIDRAGAVAAQRELTGHEDEATAIGAPPKAGKAEAYASWRAAWHALGRPEADRDEAEMSDGQLLIRIRAYQREQAWAPPYVANELAGTRQAADHHRQTAMLRAAAASAEDGERTLLERQAADAEALALALDERVTQLIEADEARARWYAHTAATRAAADRAQAELASRRANRETDEQVTTPEDTLGTAHADEADGFTITDEADFADVADQREADGRGINDTAHSDASETCVPDIREIASEERHRQPGDEVRVPTAGESADAVCRARRALAEIRAREQEDARRAPEETRAEELARWHTETRAASGERTHSDDLARSV